MSYTKIHVKGFGAVKLNIAAWLTIGFFFVFSLGFSVFGAGTPGLVAAQNPPAASSAPAKPAGNKLKLKVGEKEFWVELALTAAQQQLGLMYRTKMGEDEGMLFVYAAPHRPLVWMKNTILPLSCAFLDGQGRILEIRNLKSLDETPVASQAPNVLFMLEMNRGWFEQNEIKTGAFVSSDRGPLATLFRRR